MEPKPRSTLSKLGNLNIYLFCCFINSFILSLTLYSKFLALFMWKGNYAEMVAAVVAQNSSFSLGGRIFAFRTTESTSHLMPSSTPSLQTKKKTLRTSRGLSFYVPRESRYRHDQTIPSTDEVSRLLEHGFNLPHPHTIRKILFICQN